MDKEKYFAEKLAEHQEFVVDQIKKLAEHFGDLETRTVSLIGLSCIFPVADIKKTMEFYVSKLEFRAVEYLECQEPHICLYKDNVEIILLQANIDQVLPNRKLYGYGYDAYFYNRRSGNAGKRVYGKRNQNN